MPQYILFNYFLASTISIIPVLSSPSTWTAANAGIHTKSTPDGATKPLAIATVYSVSLQFEYLQTEAPWQAEAFKYKYIIIYERIINRPWIVT